MNTLILDKIYQPIAFVSERKMIKLFYTNRVEVVSEWDDQYFYQDLKYPAVMILKSYIRKKPVIPRFHRSMARKPLPSLLGGGGIAISFFFCLHMHFLLDLF
jgi:hypothetical protein